MAHLRTECPGFQVEGLESGFGALRAVSVTRRACRRAL